MNDILSKKIDEFKAYLIMEERSAATIEKYMHDVGHFADFLESHYTPACFPISKLAVLEWKNDLTERYAARSVNSMVAAVNSFLDFIGSKECKVKALKIQKQTFISANRQLTRRDYEKLCESARSKNHKRIYLVMQTICATGIRVSELRYMTLEAVRQGYTEVNCKGKRRTVFIPKKLCHQLREYAQEQKISSGSIFLTKNGRQLGRSQIWADMKALCSSAGVDRQKVFPHNLRHLFAKTFYAIEKDLNRLADILGHNSVETTRIYTMEDGSTHKKIIERLSLL